MGYQIIDTIIEYFMNSMEEFADAIRFPTASYTKRAFLVSLVFTISTMVLDFIGIATIVQWDEGLVCNILLGIVTLIDATTRQSAKKLALQISGDVRVRISGLKSAVVRNSESNGYEEDYDEYYEQQEYDSYQDYEGDYQEEVEYEDGYYSEDYYDENQEYSSDDNID